MRRSTCPWSSAGPGGWACTSPGGWWTTGNTSIQGKGGRGGSPSASRCRGNPPRRRRRDEGTGMLAIDYGGTGVVVITGRLDAAQSPAAQAFLDTVEGTV